MLNTYIECGNEVSNTETNIKFKFYSKNEK